MYDGLYAKKISRITYMGKLRPPGGGRFKGRSEKTSFLNVL